MVCLRRLGSLLRKGANHVSVANSETLLADYARPYISPAFSNVARNLRSLCGYNSANGPRAVAVGHRVLMLMIVLASVMVCSCRSLEDLGVARNFNSRAGARQLTEASPNSTEPGNVSKVVQRFHARLQRLNPQRQWGHDSSTPLPPLAESGGSVQSEPVTQQTEIAQPPSVASGSHAEVVAEVVVGNATDGAAGTPGKQRFHQKLQRLNPQSGQRQWGQKNFNSKTPPSAVSAESHRSGSGEQPVESAPASVALRNEAAHGKARFHTQLQRLNPQKKKALAPTNSSEGLDEKKNKEG
mmetsp:Transcript_102/g.187  ORF Transcript_102/g.187 Transcript_102/m.187 type:complete len:298 (+) Transcript_102:363-1256(+)|eukprot:CAMPEP_0198200578 /NCGR_PEP_ID=MMETSP1445-20131203/3577_1 /TAXON_ID=36898 /ORGANISM="Pyramimonas sp., Strain CCMP2087" /LENGTH=297 /DNA_ID=CAMNT_0043870699 /DNA_START=125 /DNA_END=1018 /DNA_ORIENTATION=+